MSAVCFWLGDAAKFADVLKCMGEVIECSLAQNGLSLFVCVSFQVVENHETNQLFTCRCDLFRVQFGQSHNYDPETG